MVVMIWYNLCCSNLCGVLVLICEVGIELMIVDYFVILFDCMILVVVIVCMGIVLCVLLCSKEVVYIDLGLDDLILDDVVLIDVMVVYLVLINCFIVEILCGMWLCCLLEMVCDLFVQLLVGGLFVGLVVFGYVC